LVVISIHPPAKYRLNINLIKKRKNLDADSLLPNLGKVLRAKKGNKFSRYFRLLFENERIKKVIGTNLAFLVIASSLLPTKASGSADVEINSISSPIVLNTEE